MPILVADTIVVYGDRVLGKPQNYHEFCEYMNLLSGKWHRVITGFGILIKSDLYFSRSINRVSFKTLSQHEIDQYWLSGEPFDKAGGYAIQGLGAVFVKEIQGSYSGIVGLPLYEVHDMLKKHAAPFL